MSQRSDGRLCELMNGLALSKCINGRRRQHERHAPARIVPSAMPPHTATTSSCNQTRPRRLAGLIVAWTSTSRYEARARCEGPKRESHQCVRRTQNMNAHDRQGATGAKAWQLGSLPTASHPHHFNSPGLAAPLASTELRVSVSSVALKRFASSDTQSHAARIA
jgi:hypothetical protein